MISGSPHDIARGLGYVPSMLTLDDVHLSTETWKPNENTPTHRSWWAAGDPVLFRLFASPSPEETEEGWRVRAARETADGGGIALSFDEVQIDGCRAFRGVFKVPAARCVPGIGKESLAVFIVGLIAVPLGASHLLINTEALEHGVTGSREAVYALTQPKPAPTAAIPVSRIDEVFARFGRALSTALPSDDARFDSLAPEHPLSRVRARQSQLIADLRFGEALRKLALRVG